MKGLWFVHQLLKDPHIQKSVQHLRMYEPGDKIEKRLTLGLCDPSGEGKLAGPCLKTTGRNQPVSPPRR